MQSNHIMQVLTVTYSSNYQSNKLIIYHQLPLIQPRYYQELLIYLCPATNQTQPHQKFDPSIFERYF